MRELRWVFVVACVPACASSYVVPYQQNIAYSAGPPVALESEVVGSAAPVESSRVLILESKHPPRMSEVVGVVDVHEEMGQHAEALAALRREAAALGADAVVGVEFHHGEGEGEPTHLSGLAVRFIAP